MSILQDILELQKSGIYCIINEQFKTVKIYSSNDMFKHIFYSLRFGYFSIDKDDNLLRLDVNLSDNQRRVKLMKYVYLYKDQNYTVLNDKKISRYTVCKGILTFNNVQYLYIYLKSNRRHIIPVGLFDSESDMNEFYNANYSTKGPVITDYMVSDNKLTVKYLDSLKNKE